jgi:hypothetical protein
MLPIKAEIENIAPGPGGEVMIKKQHLSRGFAYFAHLF